MSKVIALIGKPNVGKSTIFNVLVHENKAIIMDTPGVTRDRIYGKAVYKNHHLLVIDTGGITVSTNSIEEDITKQAKLAIYAADEVLFVLDGQEELSKDDYEVRDILKKSNKKVIVVVNKLDNKKIEEENIYRFYELGFDNIISISAAHKKNINKLLDDIVKDMDEDIEIEDNILKFALIGRPNVGKSSIVNALIKEERAIVSNVAGTTRDAIDTPYVYHGQEMTIIDTAGMKKKGQNKEDIERYSLIRSLRAIERADVCVIVINAEEGIIEQDKHIIGYALDSGKAMVLAVNKWDTVKDKAQGLKKWQEDIKYNMQFIPYVDVVYISALNNSVEALLPKIISAYESSSKEIPNNLLNDCIRDAYMLHVPPSYKGRRLKIGKVEETSIKPPVFTFYVNNKTLIHFSYERYLENKIRDAFSLRGTPIVLKFKNRIDE